MQIGINRWTMPGDWLIERCFAAAADAGFDTIEINLAEDGYLTPEHSEFQVRGLADAAKSAGVALSSLSSGLGWKYPLTSGDAEIRSRGAAMMRTALRAASWLGVDTVLCVPGIVDVATSYDDAYRRAQDELGALASYAEECGASIGVENVWNKFLLSPLEMARFLDEIGSGHVGCYFDAGNVLVTGYPQHWIRILGSRIRKVHVKDFRSNIGNITGFCNPLQGDVPWSEVRAALEETGYEGPVTAEVDGYRAHPEIGLRHIAESLRAAFG